MSNDFIIDNNNYNMIGTSNDSINDNNDIIDTSGEGVYAATAGNPSVFVVHASESQEHVTTGLHVTIDGPDKPDIHFYHLKNGDIAVRYLPAVAGRYTRNLVDTGNGKFNLMILCWGEGHGSAIHDHADAHCFMKMLKGELHEIRYTWPNTDPTMEQCPMADIGMNDEHSMDYDGEVLQEISRSTMETDSVCYINDTLGLHRVENPSHTESAVSLHLYCPPFDSCSIFNKKTGKRTSCDVTFWSKFGERRDKSATAKTLPEDN